MSGRGRRGGSDPPRGPAHGWTALLVMLALLLAPVVVAVSAFVAAVVLPLLLRIGLWLWQI